MKNPELKDDTEGTKNRILVVEDETIVALDLQNSLKILGYDVIGIASTGSEAVAKAGSERPDLILMDIILKGDMDGIQAAENIRLFLDVPVIFLTACADDLTLNSAKVTEPFAYMIKPFEERELRSHIEIALYKHNIEKKLRESEERYFLATQGANDGLWDWDLIKNKIYFSPRWKSMLGYSDRQIGNSPKDWFDRIHPADKEQVEQLIAQHLKGQNRHFESESRILDSRGEYRWVLCRGLARRDEKGEAYRFAGSQTDITDRKVYNPVTGLPNQVLFKDRLEHALKRARSPEKPFAVAVIEIKGLKEIAFSLGYVFADQLLCQISQIIQKNLSFQDTTAHLSNNDFALILEGGCDEKKAATVASNLQRELEKPISLDGQMVYISAHIGITLCTLHYSMPDELIRDAYTALHRIKEGEGRRIEIFDKEMRASVAARLKLETEVRKAYEDKEFRIHYQPIINLMTGELAGVEALLRWHRQDRIMYPEDFLSMAEASQLLISLERWILLEACMQIAQWIKKHGRPLSLNVNLCPKHYADPDLIAELHKALVQSGLEPNLLRLEITESALMESSETVSKALSKIRDMNIQIHMDDFGTRYSSLSYLNRFPIDSLKVDRSFVGKIGLCEETLKIVQAIVSLGKNLDKKIIAEGIENIIQLRILQKLKCDYGQGYYFAKPMTPKALEILLTDYLPWRLSFEDNGIAKSFLRGKQAS